MSRRQQGSVKRLKRLGNKGSTMSGDNTSESKKHKHIKREKAHRQ